MPNPNPLETLNQVISALDRLGETDRTRVLESVVAYYRGGAGHASSDGKRVTSGEVRPISIEQRTGSMSAIPRRLPPEVNAFSTPRSIAPSEFLGAKKPKDGTELVVCLAYFLKHFRGRTSFKTEDLDALKREAGRGSLTRPSRVRSSVDRGFLSRSGRDTLELTREGEELVLALPRRSPAPKIFVQLKAPSTSGTTRR